MGHDKKRYAENHERQAQTLTHRDGAKEVSKLGVRHANELDEKPEYTVEGVHMYPNGYRIVFENLKPYLK